MSSPSLTAAVTSIAREFSASLGASATSSSVIAAPSSSHSSPSPSAVSPSAYTTTRAVTGRFTLEFVTRRRRQWPLPDDVLPWEQWHLLVNVQPSHSQQEAWTVRETVAEGLSEMIYAVCNAINRPQYLPKMPVMSELANVYDTRFDDVQPYQFRTQHETLTEGNQQPRHQTSLSSTFKRILTDTILK